MIGYIDYIKYFKSKSSDIIVDRLKKLYPEAENSQINSWYELINVIKSNSMFNSLNEELIIGVEYSLPVDSMSVDFFICGKNETGEYMFILESKQWGDEFIKSSNFSNYRSDATELYPQTQVYRHMIAIKNYLDLGQKFMNVYPFVFVQNATSFGLSLLKSNKDIFTSQIPMTNDLNEFFKEVKSHNLERGNISITELYDAKYFPSQDIISAMSSIITTEEPFVLTKSQENSLKEITDAVNSGKKVIHISGSAGSGKTAILLNLYVKLLKKAKQTGFLPYFASGGQNTSLYRSLYPVVANAFSWTFSLQKSINKYNANKTILLIDEAQTNKNGLLKDLVDKGVILIFCYDEHQVVNLDNSVLELDDLKNRGDYVHIFLNESVRFNGSQKFDSNVKKLLHGSGNIINDENYYFNVIFDVEKLKKEVIEIIEKNPNSTVAMSGLLCSDADEVVSKFNGFFFTKWGNKQETEWIPYVYRKNYINEFNGSIWLGTWWLPGLDVDYNIVVIGGDATITSNGLIGDATKSKLYQMINSILSRVSVPKIDKDKGVCSSLSNFINYTKNIGNEKYMAEFQNAFNKLLRNYYYIMLTRGRKGCIVYFDNKQNK